jgi:hypothetical protein
MLKTSRLAALLRCRTIGARLFEKCGPKAALRSRAVAIMSREEYDRVMEALSAPSAATADPVVDLTRRFDERVARINDGTMAGKTVRLRAMTGQVPNPPIAGVSF